MQKKTRSLLEELDAMYVERDKRHVLENRANNLISNASRILEEIEQTYTQEQSDILIRKLLNAIRLRDSSKFTKSLRKVANASSRNNKED
jgi:hypothetical protein